MLRSFARASVGCALLISGLVAVGCSTGAVAEETTASESDELRALTPSEIVGTVGLGETRSVAYSASTPSSSRYVALKFSGTAGAAVDFDVTSANGDAIAWIANSTFKTLARNDDASPSTHNAHVHAVLQSAGDHYIVVRERDFEPAQFSVTFVGPSTPPPPPPPPPPVPGATCTTIDQVATAPCGACGTKSSLCIGVPGFSFWSDWSACQGEVVSGCFPGEVQNVACGNCGTRVQTCTAFCAWSAGACTGQPANSCTPGAVEVTGAGCVTGVRERECSTQCAWGPYSATCQ